MPQNSKTKIWQLNNPKFDETQKLKIWQNSITWNVRKLKQPKCEKTKNSKRDKTKKNSKCDKTKNLKLWQHWKTQNVTKLKNSKCDQTQNSAKLKNSTEIQL